MTEILNTLSHRVYRPDADGELHAIDSGRTYDGKADADNGQIKADSAEAKAWQSAHGEGETPDAITTDPLLDATVAAQTLGSALSTARLRDPHGDAEDLIDQARDAASESIAAIGQPIGTVDTDPETGAVLDPDFPSDAPDPGHPAPEPAGDSAGTLTTKAPDGSGGVVDPTPQPTPASAAPAYAEGVEFASPQAENAADELVAAGKLDASALKAGKGTGDSGAFKAGDVRGLVASE